MKVKTKNQGWKRPVRLKIERPMLEKMGFEIMAKRSWGLRVAEIGRDIVPSWRTNVSKWSFTKAFCGNTWYSEKTCVRGRAKLSWGDNTNEEVPLDIVAQNLKWCWNKQLQVYTVYGTKLIANEIISREVGHDQIFWPCTQVEQQHFALFATYQSDAWGTSKEGVTIVKSRQYKCTNKYLGGFRSE